MNFGRRVPRHFRLDVGSTFLTTFPRRRASRASVRKPTTTFVRVTPRLRRVEWAWLRWTAASIARGTRGTTTRRVSMSASGRRWARCLLAVASCPARTRTSDSRHPSRAPPERFLPRNPSRRPSPTPRVSGESSEPRGTSWRTLARSRSRAWRRTPSSSGFGVKRRAFARRRGITRAPRATPSATRRSATTACASACVSSGCGGS